jgi:phage baseplate assembly protein W
MPIIQSARRINPLDLNRNVRIGVAFPLDEENLFSGTETFKEQVKSNLLNLLLTQPCERINLTYYGVGIKHLLFEQNISLTDLKLKIQDQIVTYIPNISLKDVFTTLSTDKHLLQISLTYNYNPDNSNQQVQLNFNN